MRCVPIGHFASGHCPHINLGRSGSDSGPMSISNNLVIHYQEVKSTANKEFVYAKPCRVPDLIRTSDVDYSGQKQKQKQSVHGICRHENSQEHVVCIILVSFQPLTHSTKFYCN